MPLLNFTRRSRCPVRNMKRSFVKKLLIPTVTLTVVLLHTLILPAILGYYNDDCYLSPERYAALKELFRSIVTSYNNLNQVYWIDHGILLGYYRSKDILSHDGDIDFGRIFIATKEGVFDEAFKKKMASYYGTYGNAIVAERNYTESNGNGRRVQADLFRYTIEGKGEQRYVIEYWNKHHQDLRYKLIDQHLMQKIPYGVIFPLKKVEFLGAETYIPNDVEALLTYRYTRMYKQPIPYKWKCYLPF